MGGRLKCVQLGTEGGDVPPHVYVRTCTIFFYVLAAFLCYSRIVLFSFPIPRHKSRLSHVNIFYAITEDN